MTPKQKGAESLRLLFHYKFSGARRFDLRTDISMETDLKTIRHQSSCRSIEVSHKYVMLTNCKYFRKTNFAEIFLLLDKSKNNLKEIDQTEHFLPFCHMQTSRKLVITTEGNEKVIQI